MAAEDYFDPYDFDEDDEDGIVCKYCGESQLEWQQVRDQHNRKRWILIDTDGNVHDCKMYPKEDAIGDAFND